MQHEDDLRGLAKVMQFMRSISILMIVIHVYWYCFPWIHSLGWNIGIVDKILANFQRTCSLFSSGYVTKIFCLLLLGLSCIGTRSVPSEKINWKHILAALTVGLVLFVPNGWILELPSPSFTKYFLYTACLLFGYLWLLLAGIWIGRLWSVSLMDDRYNTENESFQQETRLVTNEDSINLPTRFYYQKKWHDGWLNITAIYRSVIVCGVPGSGKSYTVINNIIKHCTFIF